MTSALIGHTGFVGSNLARQMKFDEFYNSSNVRDVMGRQFDLVVCAGMRGEKWRANAAPDADHDAIDDLLDILNETKARRLVLISTIDAINPKDAYGTNRKYAETSLVAYINPTATVIRLPSLFGAGLKKNVLFDLLNRHRLSHVAPNSAYQWYPIARLSSDIERVLSDRFGPVNLVTPPIETSELHTRFFPYLEIGEPADDAPRYDVRSDCGYVMERAEVIEEIGGFVHGYAGCLQ